MDQVKAVPKPRGCEGGKEEDLASNCDLGHITFGLAVANGQ
jgi:hypothetical protein